MRYTFRISVGLLAFCVGTAFSAIWHRVYQQPAQIQAAVEANTYGVEEGQIQGADNLPPDNAAVNGLDCDPPMKVDLYLGVLNKKALELARPRYPAKVKTIKTSGEIVVQVIVDGITGEVIWARVVSGHPLLHEAVLKAAYQARFSKPACTSGIRSMNVSGILVYRFAGKW